MMANDGDNYVEKYLPSSIVEKLEAGAFRSLCNHLKERSNEVQNIDLMTISGFCRNCLAKWMVMEARSLAKNLDEGDNNELQDIVQSLDALGYNEAAQYIYGCDYSEWKKRHAKKASEEQMQRYEASKSLHSQFDKALLAVKGEKPDNSIPTKQQSTTTTKSSLLSNVCCQDIDEEKTVKETKFARVPKTTYTSPPLPPTFDFSVQIITVSDRAFRNEYSTGDLSGPAVQKALSNNNVDIIIVPDELDVIQEKLRHFAGKVDLILTTGGTGFAPRDVTPQATLAVVDYECRGLVSWVLNQCSQIQPLAALSRGTAGILNQTLIVNLPGNPKSVDEIMPLLLPLALHAVADLQQGKHQ